MASTLAGCGGGSSDGFFSGFTTTTTPPGGADPVIALSDQVKALAQAADPETCVTCHGPNATVALSGKGHQAEYSKYTNTSTISLTIDDVTSVPNATGGTYTSTMTFTAKKAGVALTAAEVAALDQKTFYASTYNSATRKFDKSFSYSGGTTVGNYVATGTPGQFMVKAVAATFAPESATTTGPAGTTGAQAYAYLVSGKLATEGMQLYDDATNVAKAYGDVATYASTANVDGCVKCHGTPYMKHGYRNPTVAGISDFSSCKNCHFDTGAGGHLGWQILKDDPLRYIATNAGATANLTADEKTKYAYKKNLMNDVHMAHAMEFAYPQSMKNCVTCHEGKLGSVLIESNFKAETCISCHSVDGITAKMAAATWNHADEIAAGITKVDCAGSCHKDSGTRNFSKLHGGGYDAKIYTTTGARYSDTIKASVDSASFDSTTKKLTIKFSATGTVESLSASQITPTLLVGLYGYDTKDFIVAAHGSTVINGASARNLEYVVGATHPRFTTVTNANGSWEVVADLSLWAGKITDGTIKRAEIAFMPTLKNPAIGVAATASTQIIALVAPSKTFNFTANAFETTAGTGTGSGIVNEVGGCNTCHDALATTFHSADRGGNVKVCRICHEVSSAGSHLELQSRSIDSYIHAIHSFQAFDPGDIDFTDPVAALKYEHHTASVFPNFTIKNCESCHKAGTYDVPDQSKSMPSLLSGTDTFKKDRNIGTIAASVTGPAARACGSCHRSQKINADDAGGLVAMNQHFKTFGFAVTNETGLWSVIVEKIMAPFK
jgi:OmcA/MtrC family decaheme c-type cytochrome